MIDTHIHLQHPDYADDRQATLARAVSAGVHTVIVPGTTIEDSRAAVSLATSSDPGKTWSLFAAVGIHPTEADLLDAAAIDTLASLASFGGVVAVGEIGLDYYWPGVATRLWQCAAPDVQRLAFGRQLALASELHLPVIIHDREAHRDTMDLVRSWKARDPAAMGVFHSYAGGTDYLQEVLALGFYIGIDGPVTYRRATGLQQLVREMPIDRLLLETDGPYLAPVPHRGKRNEPAYLVHVAECVAKLRDLSLSSVEAVTTENAQRLFTRITSPG